MKERRSKLVHMSKQDEQTIITQQIQIEEDKKIEESMLKRLREKEEIYQE